MIPEKSIPELRVERVIDQKTGHATVKYFWREKPIRSIQLEGDHAERMSGITLIQKDLTNALGWINKAHRILDTLPVDSEAAYVVLENREAADDVKAYFVASLVFYAKAFTEAAGRRTQMSRDWLDEKFRPPHDYFMLFRHNMAAHSGDEKIELARSHLLLVPDANGLLGVRVHTHRSQPDISFDANDKNDFQSLLSHAIEKTNEKYDRMCRVLIERCAEQGPQMWVEAAEDGVPVNVDRLIRQQRHK